MSQRIIYLHRLEFSGSSQTIQVLRDYHALLPFGYDIHLFYRAPQAMSAAEIDAWMTRHGLAPSPRFVFHYIHEGMGGKRRLVRAASALLSPGAVLAVRTMDHARAALALRQRAPGVRVVIELHEGAYPHMVYAENGRRLRAFVSRFTETRVLRRVDGIVATVGSQTPLLDERFPVHAPVAVLPNGVDLDAFAATVSKPARDYFSLRYAGQFLAWKNTDVMIEALQYLPGNVQLELAGGKPGTEDDTRAALVATAQKFGVASRVRYVGFLSPKDVPAFLKQADALLLPLGNNMQSRYFTSPMKLFEYAASGVPMVVARQPTTQSLVTDGAEALMAGANAAREWAQKIESLMQSPSLAADLAARARTWVNRYTYPERARRYHEFLSTITER
jgi:glycosyltransferase involved in cell wall biosynthesis